MKGLSKQKRIRYILILAILVTIPFYCLGLLLLRINRPPVNPTPTMSSVIPTETLTPTITLTAYQTGTFTMTPTITQTLTSTVTPTNTLTPTETPTPTLTLTPTDTPTRTPTVSPTATLENTPVTPGP